MVGRGPDEHGPEETSKASTGRRLVDLTPSSPIEKMGDTDTGSGDLSLKERKRLRRDEDVTPRVRIKRPRDVLPPPCERSDVRSSKQKEVEVVLCDAEPPKLDVAMKNARRSFDQVALYVYILFCSCPLSPFPIFGL